MYSINMSNNKYIFRFKDILVSDFNNNLAEVMKSIFHDDSTVKFDFFDSKMKKHICIFEKYISNDNCFYGRYGEIKDSIL